MLTQPKYAVVTETADGYTHQTLFETQEAALAHANYEWNSMNMREQRKYTQYIIMKGYLDERDCFNTQLAEIVHVYHINSPHIREFAPKIT